MSKGGLSRLGVLAPAALSACIDVSVLAAPAAGALFSTVLKELSKAFMLKKWFYGMMSAQEAEHLLMQKGKNGSYLVRESQSHPGEYVLSVRVRNRVSHVKIRRERNKYNVGSGEVFDDLSELIEHCRAYPLTEASGEALRLTQPVNGGWAKARKTPKMAQCLEPEDDGNPFEGDKYNPNAVGLPDEEKRTFGFYGMYEGGSTEAEFQELKQIDKRNTFTKINGNLARNAYKNRYKNVLPYDQTRVLLPREFFSLDESYGDYINANYIRPSWMFKKFLMGDLEFAPAPNEGLPLPPYADRNLCLAKDDPQLKARPKNPVKVETVENKFYVATQGCLWSTSHSFWSMIFNKDIRVIAMLTSKLENGQKKCHGYWPPVGLVESHGDIVVWTVNEYFLRHYTLTEIQISSSITKENKTIYHYMLTNWNDSEAPSDTEGVLNLIKDINKRMLLVSHGPNSPRHNILCVHCSAGIGRTGTFIAIDMLVDIVNIEGIKTHVDVYNIVRLIRTQRPGMVQNLAQYEFIYRAITDFINELKNEKTAPKSTQISI